MNNKRLIDINVSDLRTIISEIVKEELAQSTTDSKKIKMDQDLMSRGDVCRIFDISFPTMYKWIRIGVLPALIKKGGNVYFIRTEVESCMRK